jgi:Rps23 Pro-64 3,4-dihydroxylase Tpa1-like proline 4-hydroxylase
MLSSVLNSERAIQVNILIMRAFVKFRSFLSTHKELEQKLNVLEAKFGQHLEKHDEEIQAIFEAMRRMLTVEEQPKKRIGFVGGE